jgi:hypothetical protein
VIICEEIAEDGTNSYPHGEPCSVCDSQGSNGESDESSSKRATRRIGPKCEGSRSTWARSPIETCMSGLKGRVRRLERLANQSLVIIPQPAGPPARFPQSALEAAFMTNVRRLRGENVEEHPLSVAAANSTDNAWQGSFLAGGFAVSDELKELSE